MKLYNAIVFFTDRNPVKYHKVNNVSSFITWLTNNRPSANYVNLYEKVSRTFVEQIKIKKEV
jgi:hypothetical protein